MPSRKYPIALTLPLALCLVSCSASQSRNRESRVREEERETLKEVASLREEISSVKAEILARESISFRRMENRDSQTIESLTERYDTSGRLVSRTTMRRASLSRTTSTGSVGERSLSQADSSGTTRGKEDRETVSESSTLSEPPVPSGKARRIPWWKETLMYCGGAALLWIALRVSLPRLKGLLKTLKTILKL